MKLFICQYCNRETTNVGANSRHEKHCKSNPNYIKAYRSPKAGAKLGSVPWNKGSVGLQIAWNKGIAGSTTGKGSTKELEQIRINKIAEKAKLNNGGLRKGSGRGKKGWYKGYWCDSSWELAFVIYNIDHGIPFKRNTEGFIYNFKGSLHKYYPDFIIDDCYYEIKGYLSEQNLEKINSFEYNIKVIDKIGIQRYISYAKNKYGNNFVELYVER
jgi:hypothetical protein